MLRKEISFYVCIIFLRLFSPRVMQYPAIMYHCRKSRHQTTLFSTSFFFFIEFYTIRISTKCKSEEFLGKFEYKIKRRGIKNVEIFSELQLILKYVEFFFFKGSGIDDVLLYFRIS